MIYKNEKGEACVTQACETSMFVIVEIKSGFTISWQPGLLKAITQPRYKAWFSAIDLARRNAEVTINARANKESEIAFVAQLIQQSLHSDMQLNHAVAQCFWEIGV